MGKQLSPPFHLWDMIGKWCSLLPLQLEVFVGTLATIYSVGGSDNEDTIKNKMAAEVNVTGKKIFNFASGISLLLFYAFALQCAVP
jgi:Fe2+ transport system protein B